MDAIKYDELFNSSVNWIIASGSLTDSISFESSFSTIAAKPESDDDIILTGVDHVAKSPLLLLPPFPNCEPCEITITFAQEHDLRQVYIRSSARVYEIYYTKKRRHDKEYLCTVRCGIATRGEEDMLQIPLTESPSSKEPVKNPRAKDTNEDDWVEVKSADNGKDMLPTPQLGTQEFFEATAEINDAEPCVSITLRLLSLQDKSSALVDEVYVFADPIDQTEPEQEEASGTGNSSSSSLMAMFMPTLLQLSRGKDVRKERDKEVSDSKNPGTPGKIANEIRQETNFGKADHRGGSSPVLLNTPANHVDATEVSEAEPTMSCNNMETILHLLVNKVSHIESILTRFEDQMLKPINSIDARLQLVEEKLEQLGKKSLESELLVEVKTPNSDSLSSDTDKTPETNELDGLTKQTVNPKSASDTGTIVPESSSIDSSEDYSVVVLPNIRLEQANEKTSISENEVISAKSEISNEEVNHSFGRGAVEENPNRSLSINDALASALAGLLSSTSITDRKYSPSLVVTAPEFLNDDDLEMETEPQNCTHPDKSNVAAEESGNICSALVSPTSPQNEPGTTLCIEDYSQEKIGVPEKSGDSVQGYNNAETVVSVRNNDLDEETVTSSTKTDCYTENNPDTLVHEPENPIVATAQECRGGESGMDDVLKSVLSFRPSTPSVDFLTPVLDVKFNSDKKVSDNKCFFGALLTTESNKSIVDCNYNEGFDDKLVSMEDEEEVKGPPTDTLLSLEMDHYETNEMHLQLNAEISTASLI